jgi:hypothetical protein
MDSLQSAAEETQSFNSVYHRIEFYLMPKWRQEFAEMQIHTLQEEYLRLSELLARIHAKPEANGCNCHGWYECEACAIIGSRRTLADCFLDSIREEEHEPEPDSESEYGTCGNEN